MKAIHTLIYISIVVTAFLSPSRAMAVLPGDVRWHNEESDTTKITRMLVKASKADIKSGGDLVVLLAREFIGTPYGAGTLESQPERLTINLDSVDCTTFVETVLAMTLTVKEGRTSWQDLVYNLGNIRYRQGRLDGYSSRLHYISDWIVDNSHRGNITEMTGRLPNSTYMVKTLDFMTSNRDKYPALADSAEFERLKNFEVGYRSHRFPYLRSSTLMGKWAQQNLMDGDIIAFTTKTKGLDVSHIGIIVMKNDGPHLLHASSRAGKVIEETRNLSEYFKKNPGITGARILRPGAR